MIYSASELFLGYAASEEFLSRCSSVNYSIYVSEDPYLYEVEIEKSLYLGKFVRGISGLEALASMEANIHSLLKKIAPEFSADTFPLLLKGWMAADGE